MRCKLRTTTKNSLWRDCIAFVWRPGEHNPKIVRAAHNHFPKLFGKQSRSCYDIKRCQEVSAGLDLATSVGRLRGEQGDTPTYRFYFRRQQATEARRLHGDLGR